jgi:hypothetical protein
MSILTHTWDFSHVTKKKHTLGFYIYELLLQIKKMTVIFSDPSHQSIQQP